MSLHNYLKGNILLFDGAMGTYLVGKDRHLGSNCEKANLEAPELVSGIHKEYLAAGCNAIKTNTFGANRLALGEETCKKVIEAGWRIAREAAGNAFVFADIGPIGVDGPVDLIAEYQFVADIFLRLGAKNFLFETHSRDTALHETAAYIKEKCPDSFIILSFAALPDGFTRDGLRVGNLISKIEQDPNIDGAGLNCVTSARHMTDLVKSLLPVEKFLSIMPNAGYPTVLENRTVYDGSPSYFAQQMAHLGALGVKILGGCCGTTPEHLAATAKAMKEGAFKTLPLPEKKPKKAEKKAENPFWEALCDKNQKPFAVELDPPEGADVEKFINGARELRDNGAAIVTIADCPIARARMDSSLLACKLRRELGVQALPHMTCRDRNLNAVKALLLGLCAEDVHNVLVVTGDPIPTASRDEVKSVYNFNSRMLAHYITGLGESALPTPFHVFGALNLNARNFHVQLELAKQKEENGVCGFLTQPVLTAQALENLKTARKTLSGKLLGGIMPVVSHRNAMFMNSEVAGITVDDRIVSLYEGLDREQGEALAVKISAAVAKEMEPYIDGYYLITPFGRTGLMARIMKEIRQQG